MKIIDKTPFQDEAGQFSVSGRAQRMLKYGLNWFTELEAQKTVIAQLERSLEKGFVLIRNFTLPTIEAVIPIILIGPGGISVIHVTPAKGQFEAKGDQWNNINYGLSQPARVNLIEIVMKRARALQKYLESIKISLPMSVEAVIIASDPGAHIDSLRPVARVVMSDAIKQYAGSLLQARPLWRPESVYDMAERIINPHPPAEPRSAAPKPSAPVVSAAPAPKARPVSRAKAIFNATDTARPFDPSEFDFAFEEGQPPFAPQSIPHSLIETNPSRQLPPRTESKKGRLGLSGKQAVLLAGLIILECLIIAGFGAVVIYMSL
jgi:hypothetical protein